MRLVMLVGLVLVATVGCAESEDGAQNLTSTSTDETATTTSEAPPTSEAGPEFVCEPYSVDETTPLITRDDGTRRLEGEVVASVQVLSDDLVYVAINVDGTVLALAHQLPDGFWASLDDTTESVTSFPQNADQLGAAPDHPAALAAIECALAG